MKTFWILWNPEGKTPPTVMFNNLAAAKDTAAKMQTNIGPGMMYVMQVVGGVRVEQVATWLPRDKNS